MGKAHIRADNSVRWEEEAGPGVDGFESPSRSSALKVPRHPGHSHLAHQEGQGPSLKVTLGEGERGCHLALGEAVLG